MNGKFIIDGRSDHIIIKKRFCSLYSHVVSSIACAHTVFAIHCPSITFVWKTPFHQININTSSNYISAILPYIRIRRYIRESPQD